MRKLGILSVMVLLFVACAGKNSTGTGTGSGTAAVDQPLPPPTPRPPPARDPVVDTEVAKDWWKQGAAACPKTGRLDGEPPPRGYRLRCLDDKFIEQGPDAAFSSVDGSLVAVGTYVDGRRQGRFVAYFPDGTRVRQGTYLRGERHGTWTEWHPDGQVFTTGAWVDGRADGEHVWTGADGKELGRVTMTLGTGAWTTWRADGSKEATYAYAAGLAHGPYTTWHPDGTVASTGRFIDGKADGTWLSFDLQGRKRQEQRYLRDSLTGDQTRWDEAGAITEVVRYEGSASLWRVRYLDGKPLTQHKPTACDGSDGLHRLLGTDDGTCVDRAVHFPGLVLLGSFAHDRGCMGSGYVLDCRRATGVPDARAALVRAGWATAPADEKQVLADALVREVLHRYDGSVASEPTPPKTEVAADGSAVLTYWLQEPSGMQRGWTRHLTETRIASDGAIAEQRVRTESGGRD